MFEWFISASLGQQVSMPTSTESRNRGMMALSTCHWNDSSSSACPETNPSLQVTVSLLFRSNLSLSLFSFISVAFHFPDLIQSMYKMYQIQSFRTRFWDSFFGSLTARFQSLNLEWISPVYFRPKHTFQGTSFVPTAVWSYCRLLVVLLPLLDKCLPVGLRFTVFASLHQSKQSAQPI
jgi:hypothetical protein